jgi:hypothetical protein
LFLLYKYNAKNPEKKKNSIFLMFLVRLDSHRKGAKGAEDTGFPLAVVKAATGKGLKAKGNQVNLKTMLFSFPLSRRKAEESSPLRSSRLCGEPDS